MQIKEILARLADILDTEVYAVGGAVRDYIMGQEPHDIDFCSGLTPTQVLERCAAKGIKAIDVGGAKYGTIVVVLDNDSSYEITTFRSDHNCDGRHAEVAFASNILIDLSRRDFTCNAMAMDSAGEILDPYRGQDAICEGVLSAVGDAVERFSEDYLRIVRAMRFKNRFDWDYDVQLEEAMSWMGKDVIAHVSIERVVSEIDKAFQHCNKERFLDDMFDYRVLSGFVPEISARTDRVRCALRALSGDLCWPLLFAEVIREPGLIEGISVVDDVCKRLKLSTRITKLCQKFHQYRQFLAQEIVSFPGRIYWFKYKCGEDAEDILTICKQYWPEYFERYTIDNLDNVHIAPIISYQEVSDALQESGSTITDPKGIGDIWREVHHAQLDCEFRDHTQGMIYLKRMVGNGSNTSK